MNSIETYSPPKATTLESEESTLLDITSDPAALEALRSLLGGAPPPPLNTTTLPCPVSNSPLATNPAPNHESYQLTALVAELQKAFASKGDVTSKPEVVAQMKTLLQTLQNDTPETTSTLPAPVLSSPNNIFTAASMPADAPPTVTASPLHAITIPATTTVAAPINNASTAPALPASLPTLLQAFQEASTYPPAQTSATQQVLQTLRLDLVKALTEAVTPSTPSATDAQIAAEPGETATALGAAILQSLGHQSSAFATHAAPPPSAVPTAERVEHVSALITQMANRVLVTDPVHGQNPEVRIKLADNVMPGTEVRVWREEGQLRVSFETTSPHWARVLNEASPLLTQRLNERLPNEGFAQVTVQQQGGQPEDGRSRNRHTAWELAQQAGDE